MKLETKTTKSLSKKGGMPSYPTVDDYIQAQPLDAQKILQSLRAIIKEVVPEVAENRNNKVPSFRLVDDVKPIHQLMCVGYAKHVSFYPFEKTIDHFAQELKGYEIGKGTVKFSFDKDLPKELIKQMVMYRKQELLESSTL